jgi:hypothetical protein
MLDDARSGARQPATSNMLSPCKKALYVVVGAADAGAVPRDD